MPSLTPLTKTYSSLRNVPFPDVSSYLAAQKSYWWLFKEAMLGLRLHPTMWSLAREVQAACATLPPGTRTMLLP